MLLIYGKMTWVLLTKLSQPCIVKANRTGTHVTRCVIILVGVLGVAVWGRDCYPLSGQSVFTMLAPSGAPPSFFHCTLLVPLL